MRVGVYAASGEENVEEVVDLVRAAAQAGLDSVWLSQVFGWDALTLAALAGREVPGIEIGTAVVPTFPRHPIALAAQALTAQAATGGRLSLGVGPSHRAIIEGAFGLSYDRPARHTRAYLSALGPLLRGEAVEYRGEALSAVGTIEVPGKVAPPPVLLAALGPAMLRIAGELADGTVTTWATPATIADDISPRITEAARAAGRGAPRVIAGVLASVTGDPDRARGEIAERLGHASDLPSYRALLDRQGLAGVADTALVGDEETVAAGLRAYADAGATDVLVSSTGSDAEETARTFALLSAVRRDLNGQSASA
ncbi:TIGR03564 family F420-dependent LLM class oxidoreductase [Streptomyces radicis]|uniref:TIGR03564 family F420-dependent LLM class oxidoreductase n=1 Tax=Streptomyces radicis TaxID=1750517 RepID=A0A3A9WCM8_9ACTN|nr:TIGR03564 family F420-dependent LLM class oxidoreductase [Streptomyces radicis]RKN05396.1 TIGR03564 family F420-dependent LLM class oxidoreductase [Streptomyces radicis]RKN16904.1 TIGR03564 family F420-dependent LLM class oxidoreductase [Streptomyces radicis]